ncbi:Cc8K15.2-like protein [Daphnia magna]|uniref:Cc8K15.2-like protein n=1 Tax=Daphnia magna TaxID=35525 RepID=A0A164E859_9CRUS|nr:Cc8K15.2-like protein [Daphnia magna]
MRRYMTWYEKECKEIAGAAITSCKRHLWYLTEELVVLCIFNENLSVTTRFLVAHKLFNTPKPNEFPPGKPSFPDFNIEEIPLLLSLIGP